MPFVSSLLPRVSSSVPQAQSGTAPATAGAAYTIPRLLGSTSTLSLTSASNGNLTISGNVISQTNPIFTTKSQVAIVREALGNTAIEYPVTLSGTYVPPAVTPLPSGIAAMWDPASLNLADGAAVTSWTDGVGGSVATQTSASTTPHTFVANSGGLPAVRLSGAAVMTTTGTNTANTAMTSNENGIVVIARAIQTPASGSSNPCLVSSGTGTNMLLQASPTNTGKYAFMTSCADAGMRSIGVSNTQVGANGSYGLLGINGTAIHSDSATGGQIAIGGWKDVNTACNGRADILGILVFNRAVTAADYKQIHRHYCDLLGQAYPGGKTSRNVSMIGDSLTEGYPVGFSNSYPYQLSQGLGLPWGTWDQMGRAGYTWSAMQNSTLPMMGNISGVIGTKNIVCMFEFANMRGSSGATVAAAARSVINKVISNETSCDIVFGTSTDDGSPTGVNTRQNRIDYNNYWDTAANRTGITTYVQLHLDPNIGVIGCAPTNQTANTYYALDPNNAATDPDLHLSATGYAQVDNGPYGFRAAVQARLAAS